MNGKPTSPAPERSGASLEDATRVNPPRRTVRLQKSHSGDEVVEVGYNGQMFLIRRGETVAVPLPVLEILERAGLC